MTVERSFSAASLGSPRVFRREKPAMSWLLTTETFSMPSPPASVGRRKKNRVRRGGRAEYSKPRTREGLFI